MENQNDADSKKDKIDSEKLKTYIDEMAKGKKSPIAKEIVSLKHVETKKQKVSKETINLSQNLKAQIKSQENAEALSNDEITVLESFMEKSRLFLSRIAIIVNQSRVVLGNEGLKKAELEDILNSLINKGYLETQVVNENTVYILTESGKDRIQ